MTEYKDNWTSFRDEWMDYLERVTTRQDPPHPAMKMIARERNERLDRLRGWYLGPPRNTATVSDAAGRTILTRVKSFSAR